MNFFECVIYDALPGKLLKGFHYGGVMDPTREIAHMPILTLCTDSNAHWSFYSCLRRCHPPSLLWTRKHKYERTRYFCNVWTGGVLYQSGSSSMRNPSSKKYFGGIFVNPSALPTLLPVQIFWAPTIRTGKPFFCGNFFLCGHFRWNRGSTSEIWSCSFFAIFLN